MLVVTLGKVVFTRRMTPAENGVDIVQARLRGLVAHIADLDLDFATIGQVHFLRGPKDAVFVHCMDCLGHVDSLFAFCCYWPSWRNLGPEPYRRRRCRYPRRCVPPR